MTLTFDTSEFEAAHGRTPRLRERALWRFRFLKGSSGAKPCGRARIDGPSRAVPYSVAQSWAWQRAQRLGAQAVAVLPFAPPALAKAA
jgi:hypothetical protein